MSDDYAEMRERAEKWVRACEAVRDPSSAVHARDVLALLDERDALRKWAAEQAAEWDRLCEPAAGVWQSFVARIDGKGGP